MNVRGDNLTISKKKTISSLERKRRRRGGGRKYQSANVRGGGGLAEEKEGGDGLSTKSSEKGEGSIRHGRSDRKVRVVGQVNDIRVYSYTS